MKVRIILYLLINLVILNGCSKIISLVSKNPDTEGKVNIKSKYNQDNKVFTENKIYTYEVNQENENQTINFELTLQVIPGNYNKESKVKYKYYYNLKSFSDSIIWDYIDTNKHFKWEITSVDESKDYVCIHPPRAYSLTSLELAPFPAIILPPNQEKSWETNLWVGPGWGEYSGKTIKNNYKITSLRYINSSDFIATISTTSNSKLGSSSSKYTYNSIEGFTLIKYELPNKSMITLKMKY